MQLINGLRINWEAGEGSFMPTDKFKMQDGMFRADVLHDWLKGISAAYQDAVYEMGAYYANMTVEAYKAQCEARHAQDLLDNMAAFTALKGRTITEVDRMEDGGVVLSFSDGTRHAIYQADVSAQRPIQLTHDLNNPPMMAEPAATDESEEIFF